MIDNAPIDTGGSRVTPDGDEWLSMARDAFTQSTDWFDASLRQTIEKSQAHFANRHGLGSKYFADSYKYRSKGFRPKTRATIRRNEAAAAVAFFSTQDMVSIEAENQDDNAQALSAAVLSEIVNYRLDDSIPWFQTLVGAYQNAMVTGIVVSHQSWEFAEEMVDGEPVMPRTITDKPRIDLVAVENFRIAPASDWVDPIGTSPFVIEMIPMFIGAIKEKMASGKWIEYASGEIQTAAQSQYDSIRVARDGRKRQDSVEVTYATSDFDTVFVHRNIIRKDGKDVIFYTLGTFLRLTEPKLLTEEYPHLRTGERPYVMGSCMIETHKTFPAGIAELTFQLQEEANDINNQRRDNVSLVMNKRYFARRTANVDYKSLTRNVPGSVTLVDDINADIRWDSPPDVTGSSYQEQDRVSLDYDELAGTFSPGSVQSNRQTGETVGGMQMLANDSNMLTEYQLRVFAETWVEPVLKQLVRLEQANETDEIVLAIAGSRANSLQKFGVDAVTDQMLQGTVTVNVNVGFGATNPQKRIEKLVMGLQAIAGFAPQVMQGLDAKEAVFEVFGALGYKSAARFFPTLGDEQQQPQPAPPDPRIEVAKIRAKTEEDQILANTQIRMQEIQIDDANKDEDRALKDREIQGRQATEIDKLKAQLAIKTMELRTQQSENQLARAQQDDHVVSGHMMHNEDGRRADAQEQIARTSIEPAGRATPGNAFAL